MTPSPNDHLERTVQANSRWLREAMAPYFFAAMQDEPEALRILEQGLGTLRTNQHLILADRPKALILAAPNTPGSLYRTISLGAGSQRAISYAMFAHSDRPMPGMEATLEIQRFEYDCKTDAWVKERLAAGVAVPRNIRDSVAMAMHADYRDFDMKELDQLLALFWLCNPAYTRVSPPRRVAQIK